MVKNKVISIIISCILFVSFCIPVFAVSPYGSVNQNSSQVQILFAYLQNDVAFDPLSDFLILRTGEYEYSAYFNIDGSDASRLRYIAHRTGNYIDYWYFVRDDVEDFSYTENQYTVVGTLYGCIALTQYDNFKFQMISIVCSIISMFCLLLFLFRIHKRGVNL